MGALVVRIVWPAKKNGYHPVSRAENPCCGLFTVRLAAQFARHGASPTALHGNTHFEQLRFTFNRLRESNYSNIRIPSIHLGLRKSDRYASFYSVRSSSVIGFLALHSIIHFVFVA
jgi:hypothetical protein